MIDLKIHDINNILQQVIRVFQFFSTDTSNFWAVINSSNLLPRIQSLFRSVIVEWDNRKGALPTNFTHFIAKWQRDRSSCILHSIQRDMSRDINWCHESQNGMKKIVKISSVHALTNFELSMIASVVADYWIRFVLFEFPW